MNNTKINLEELMGSTTPTLNTTGGADKKALINFIEESLKVNLGNFAPSEVFISAIQQLNKFTDSAFAVTALGIKEAYVPALLGQDELCMTEEQIQKLEKLGKLDEGFRYEVYMPHSATKVVKKDDRIVIEAVVKFYSNDDSHPIYNNWTSTGFMRIAISMINPVVSTPAQA